MLVPRAARDRSSPKHGARGGGQDGGREAARPPRTPAGPRPGRAAVDRGPFFKKKKSRDGARVGRRRGGLGRGRRGRGEEEGSLSQQKSERAANWRRPAGLAGARGERGAGGRRPEVPRPAAPARWGCSPSRSVVQVRPRPARRRPSAPRSPAARRPPRPPPAGGGAGSARGPFLPAAPLRLGDGGARSGPGSPAPASGAPLMGAGEARGGWGALGAASRCLFRACRTILA